MTRIPPTSDPDLAAYRAPIEAARADRDAGPREPLSWLTAQDGPGTVYRVGIGTT